MNLGTETASMTNFLMSSTVKNEPTPVVGMGATILMWTDRKAGTVIKTFTDREHQYIWVQEDRATRTDKNGMSESQSYYYSPDPNGATHLFRKSNKGRWESAFYNEETQRFKLSKGNGLMLGERQSYHDYSF